MAGFVLEPLLAIVEVSLEVVFASSGAHSRRGGAPKA